MNNEINEMIVWLLLEYRSSNSMLNANGIYALIELREKWNIKKADKEFELFCKRAKGYEEGIRKLEKEIVSLKQDIEVLKDNELKAEVIMGIKQQAIKEFARKFKRDMYRKMIMQLKGDTSPDLYSDDIEAIIDNLLKEYGIGEE